VGHDSSAAARSTDHRDLAQWWSDPTVSIDLSPTEVKLWAEDDGTLTVEAASDGLDASVRMSLLGFSRCGGLIAERVQRLDDDGLLRDGLSGFRLSSAPVGRRGTTAADCANGQHQSDGEHRSLAHSNDDTPH
jgi:hypothetical protein